MPLPALPCLIDRRIRPALPCPDKRLSPAPRASIRVLCRISRLNVSTHGLDWDHLACRLRCDERGALTFIAPHFWTFTKIGKTGRCSVENYCGKTMTRASALDLCGTFLGCVRRVWVCSMVSVSKSAVTRAPTIALHETGTSSPSSQFGVVEKTIVCLLGHL